MRNATATLMLIVAVTTGSVNVQYEGKTYEIGAGTRKVFGGEREPYYDPGSKGLNWTSVEGFSGQVRGVVKGVGDDGQLKFYVARVLKTWDGNKARKPQALKGNTLNIGPRRENHKTGTGKPVHRHLAYIKTLRKGAEITLEIYNPKGKEWHILELDQKQRAIADRLMRDRERDGDERDEHRDDRERDVREERRDGPDREREKDTDRKEHRDGPDREDTDRKERRDGPDREGGEREERRDGPDREGGEREQGRLPEGMHGFQGMLVGKIVKKNRDYFVLKVEKVTKVWKGNKARNPKSVVGREIEIDFAKKTRLSRKHQTTYRKLRTGDRVSVEPFHFGGQRLSVVEELKRIR